MYESDTPTINENERFREVEEHDADEETKRTPLPKFQLFIVFLIQFAEPVTATVIYPFVNQFVRETGIIKGDERKTGYYAGIIESAFFFAEAFTVFQWGWASDRLGRRPILLLGPIGLAFFMFTFGLSSNYWPLVVTRCMQGVFNGNIGVSKTVIAEITDASNIADAFAMIPLMWSFGSTIGPVLGGVLSRPATNWPGTFGKVLFFHQHPYFLPCAVAAFIAFVSGAIACIGLKETLPSAVLRQEQEKKRICTGKSDANSATTLLNGGDVNNYGAINDLPFGSDYSPVEAGAAPPTTSDNRAASSLSAILTPDVVSSLLPYVFLAFVDMSSQVLQPLVYSTSVSLGGLGLDPYRIGVIMGTWGIVNAFVQMFLLAKLLRRFSPKKIHIISQCSYVIIIGLYPVLSYFARRAGGVDTKVWIIMVIQLCFQMTNNMAYGSIMIIIVDSAPRASLGATNGIAQALGSGMRSIAPSAASSLFSISLEKQLAGGNMVYLILIGISLVGIRLSLLLPNKTKKL